MLSLPGFCDLARLRRASESLPRPGSLSLACPRESNQRERHPAWRCLGVAQPVREGRPGFSTGLLPGRKVPDVLSGTPAGPARPPLTAPQGRGEGSCRWAAHRIEELKTSVRCGSAPCARPRTDVVASIRDRRDWKVKEHRHVAVAHWVRSYRDRRGFGEHPPLTPALSSLLKAAAIHGRSLRAPEGRAGKNEAPIKSIAAQRSGFKSSSHRRVAVWRLRSR